jgi:predicted RNA-binding Zn-ribbon protein involved in translation (DUF1610 family)
MGRDLKSLPQVESTMIKLRADWHQACPSCGTEVVVDFLNQCPAEFVCPWCGAAMPIGMGNGDGEARERLSAALMELEEQMNAQLPVLRLADSRS